MVQGIILLFGATGDLSKRRIIPALYALMRDKKMEPYIIIGTALENYSRQHVLDASKPYLDIFDQESWILFQSQFYYYTIDITMPEDFTHLAQYITQRETAIHTRGNHLVYLAIPPQFFASTTRYLAASRIITVDSHKGVIPWTRVIYEKPFGSDQQSARALQQSILTHLKEFQIFCVDHYLAKDIVESLALLRFTNRIFEPLWNHEHIDWIEIVLSETAHMDGRGHFYDHCGVLNDVVQNHMLQIVALIAMEAPQFLSGDYIRNEKARVLHKVHAVDGILAQYRGYLNETGVAPHSTTPTFAVLKLFVNAPRWNNVPFYLKTGKGLMRKETIINVQFKSAKCLLTTACPSDANYLNIRVFPQAGFSLVLNVKKPGIATELLPVPVNFSYDSIFKDITNNTYELVFQEIISGEEAISVRFDEIEYSWHIIDHFKRLDVPLLTYDVKTSGPTELLNFAQKHRMRWRL